jgi:threonine dehydrogenase-like Zn-dependent dehydrogenase
MAPSRYLKMPERLLHRIPDNMSYDQAAVVEPTANVVHDVIERAKSNGYDFTRGLPDTAQTVSDLQTRAHAFFLQVGGRPDVDDQWTEIYGADHKISLPGSTQELHYVKAVIIGLTEGVLDLETAKKFMVRHELGEEMADRIVRAVAHIPLGAQMLAENFGRIPLAGTYFKEKTDLWPVDPSEVVAAGSESVSGEAGPGWL